MEIKAACVVGLGYVGLTLSAFLASKGIWVHGVDVDEDKVEVLRQGEMPLHEPGVKELLSEHRDKLHFSTIPKRLLPPQTRCSYAWVLPAGLTAA